MSDKINEDIILDELDIEEKRNIQKKDIINDFESYETKLDNPETIKTIKDEEIKIVETIDESEFSNPGEIIFDNLDEESIEFKEPDYPEDIEIEDDIYDSLVKGIDIKKDKLEIAFDVTESSNKDEQLIEEPIIEDLSINEIKVEPEQIIEDKEELEIKEEPEQTIEIDEDSDIPIKSEDISLDENIESKEFINRKETIYSDVSLSNNNKYPVPKGYKYDKSDEDEEPSSGLLKKIIFSFSILLVAFLIGIGINSFVNPEKSSRFTDEELTYLTDSYNYILAIQTHLNLISIENSKETMILDEYIASGTDVSETVSEIETILKEKERLKADYELFSPKNGELFQLKKMSDNIMDSSIDRTAVVMNNLNSGDSKASLVDSFNESVNKNNSNINLYNQYVMSIFTKYNIDITLSGENFVIDSSWIKN